MIAWMTWR